VEAAIFFLIEEVLVGRNSQVNTRVQQMMKGVSMSLGAGLFEPQLCSRFNTFSTKKLDIKPR